MYEYLFAEVVFRSEKKADAMKHRHEPSVPLLIYAVMYLIAALSAREGGVVSPKQEWHAVQPRIMSEKYQPWVGQERLELRPHRKRNAR